MGEGPIPFSNLTRLGVKGSDILLPFFLRVVYLISRFTKLQEVYLSYRVSITHEVFTIKRRGLRGKRSTLFVLLVSKDSVEEMNYSEVTSNRKGYMGSNKRG